MANGVQWIGSGQGYNAADTSTMRGYIYFPQLDTRRELTSYSRMEIIRRVRYLDANVGFAGRILSGLSRMVAGTGLMVRATTEDREWNADRNALFEERNGSAAVFDLAKKNNFYSCQRGMMRARYRDGDMGVVLTETASRLASVSIVEAHRIGNGKQSTEEINRMIDGVLLDKYSAAESYRVLGDDAKQADIPASVFCYLGDASNLSKVRSPSILHRACNHLVDITEINTAIKSGIKQANRIGYYIGYQPTTSGFGIPPMGEGPTKPRDSTLADGRRVKIEEVLTAGGEIPGLPPGADIKQLLDTRPHPNTAEFLKALARDICWGVDMSPEVLWDIAALGGANTRYVMADAQSFIDQEQQMLVDAFLARYYLYDTAKELAAGRIRKCRDPKWWKHAFIPPSRMTVDRGRDGKLYLEQVRSGALTFKRMYGWEGLDSSEELNEWLDEMAEIAESAKKRGLDPEKTLDRIYGRPGTQSSGQQVAEENGTTQQEASKGSQ